MSTVLIGKADRWKDMFSSLKTGSETPIASTALVGGERPIRRVVIPAEANHSGLPAFGDSDIANIQESDQVGRVEEENPVSLVRSGTLQCNSIFKMPVPCQCLQGKPTISIERSKHDAFIDFNPPGALPGSPFHAAASDTAATPASEPVVDRRPRPNPSVDHEVKKQPKSSSTMITTSLPNKQKSRFYTTSSRRQSSVSSASLPSAPPATRRRSRELLPSAFAHATTKQQTKLRPQLKAHASGAFRIVGLCSSRDEFSAQSYECSAMMIVDTYTIDQHHLNSIVMFFVSAHIRIVVNWFPANSIVYVYRRPGQGGASVHAGR